LAAFLLKQFGSEHADIIRISAFLLFSVLAFVAMRLIDSKLSTIFHAKLSGPLKPIGGAVFGIFYALLLWSFFSQALVMMRHFPQVKRVYESGNSVTGHQVKLLAPAIYQTVTGTKPRKKPNAV
jgi:uncharacterized membrane protein required for colicin V production